MKTITFESNYGNFSYRMTAEIGDEVNAATEVLCTQGLANICYRVAGSSVDKALGVKERKGVEYSDNDGERINAAVSDKLTKMLLEEKTKGLAPLKLSFAVTGQHEFGSTSDAPSKEATELWVKVQAMQGEKFEKALKVLGLNEDYTDESGILAAKKFLQAAKKAAQVAAAAALGA